MIRLWMITMLAALLMVPGGACADEKEPRNWSDQAEFSFVNTGGNTSVTTLSLNNVLKYRVNQSFSLSWKLEALNSMSNGSQTAERYMTEVRSDYLFTERLYGIFAAGWLKDTFAGIDSRYNGNLGVGYKFLTGPKHTLLGEAGFIYAAEEYINNSSKDYPGGRTFFKYLYAITKKSSFSQSLESLHSFERVKHFVLNSETAATGSLTDIFSLKASYIVRYHGEPDPPTLKNTDTILGMALVANF